MRYFSVSRSFKSVVVTMGLVASTLAISAQPSATAAETKPRSPKPVPALASEVLDQRPQAPAGDFSSPPPAPAERSSAPTTREPLDISKSALVDDQTTPTRAVYDNPDGTRTAVVSQVPIRQRDGAGAWRNLDPTIDVSGDRLAPRFSPGAATLGRTAAGVVAQATTSAGVISLRHPSATDVAGVASDISVRYPRALDGSDLVIRPSAGGFEESVIIGDASVSSYVEELVLPDGVSVRQAGADIELIDRSGSVVARYGGGVAYDTALSETGPAGAGAVVVTLVWLRSGVARLEVSVDSKWLSDPSRAFPVTIDPIFSAVSSAAGAVDTFVYSAAPTTAYGTHPWLVSGTPDAGASIYRPMLDFDTSSLPTGANVRVLASTLGVFQWYSYAGSCLNRTGFLGGS